MTANRHRPVFVLPWIGLVLVCFSLALGTEPFPDQSSENNFAGVSGSKSTPRQPAPSVTPTESLRSISTQSDADSEAVLATNSTFLTETPSSTPTSIHHPSFSPAAGHLSSKLKPSATPSVLLPTYFSTSRLSKGFSPSGASKRTYSLPNGMWIQDWTVLFPDGTPSKEKVQKAIQLVQKLKQSEDEEEGSDSSNDSGSDGQSTQNDDSSSDWSKSDVIQLVRDYPRSVRVLVKLDPAEIKTLIQKKTAPPKD